MSIVVYWQEQPGVPGMEIFDSGKLQAALALCEIKRKEGKRHVCISSELAESVGHAGVNTVADRRLPDGSPYDWTKSHRGAGPQNPGGKTGGQ
ncbi:hypothetical protein KW843_23570 [Acidovorax sp. sif1233]|uniref:hypothetical protein n=1 Tax=unclassified Acidovorax TaxID=2684926 RepID=UPI001C446294|nr:hypothetical protein [Acidovorax sp. sif1233]MBV7457472.1 hypothetical protein [Acidovorax sp. sif1233]